MFIIAKVFFVYKALVSNYAAKVYRDWKVPETRFLMIFFHAPQSLKFFTLHYWNI